MKRRDLLFYIAGTIGSSIVLTGCGSSGSGTDNVLINASPTGSPTGTPTVTPTVAPNAFKFTEVINQASLALPDTSLNLDTLAARLLAGGGNGQPPSAKELFRDGAADFDSFIGTLIYTQSGRVFFHARDTAGRIGIYELFFDVSTTPPTPKQIRKVVRQGDTLADGSVVANVGIGDGNSDGLYVTVVSVENETKTVYSQHQDEGMQKLIGFLDPTPGNSGEFGAIFGDISLNDKGQLLIAAHYNTDDGYHGQGAFFIENRDPQATTSKVVLTSQSLFPDTSDVMGGIGLLQLGNDGTFVAQAAGQTTNATDTAPTGPVPQPTGSPVPDPPATSDNPTGETQDGGTGECGGGECSGGAAKVLKPSINAKSLASNPSVTLMGHVEDPSSVRLRAASKSVSVDPRLRGIAAREKDLAEGSTIYGPRMGADGTVAQVLHIDDTTLAFFVNGKEVIRSGQKSPGGSSIYSLSGPVVGAGLVYIVLICQERAELCFYAGGQLKTVLSSGDKVGDNVVQGLCVGQSRDQVDEQGRLLFLVDYDDTTQAMIMAQPV